MIQERGVLQRNADESGVSGEGVVADYVVFRSGRTVIEWRNDQNENVTTEGNGLAIYDSLDDAEEVHGHNGKTEFKARD